MSYREFRDTQELVAQLVKGYVLYKAPLDTRPYTVKVRRVVLDLYHHESKSSVTFWHSETGVLKVNMTEHFNRFQKREDSE